MAMQQVEEQAEQRATLIAKQQAAQQTADQAEQKATDQAEQKAALQPTTSNPSATTKALQPQGRSSYGILPYLDDDADSPPLPTGPHKPAVHTKPPSPEHSATSRRAQAPSPVDAGASGLGPITPTPGAPGKSPQLPRGCYGILRHLNRDTEDDADPNSQNSAAHLRPYNPQCYFHTSQGRHQGGSDTLATP
jgi:hypothetical protein